MRVLHPDPPTAVVPTTRAVTAGRAPLLVLPSRWSHTSSGDFCTVCGGVWPCATALRGGAAPAPR